MKTIGSIRKNNQGFVLVTTLLVIALFLTLLATYYTTTYLEISSSADSATSADGFFAAEAGLNIKAEAVRSIFLNFAVPVGTPPSATSPCSGTNNGTGDYACASTTYNGRIVKTYMSDTATNPVSVTIPQGELYQNLNAQEYRYTTHSTATNSKTNLNEADLELRFKTRLVPLFQFAMFYNKDMEILPQETMNLSGPVHTNRDMYMDSSAAVLTVNGQVTAAGSIYRGRKNTDTCSGNSVKVYNPTTATTLISSCSNRVMLSNTDLVPFNSMIQKGVQTLTVPDIGVIDPVSTSTFWARADLRLVLTMNSSDAPYNIEVRNADNSVNTAGTTAINTNVLCTTSSGGVSNSRSLSNGTIGGSNSVRAVGYKSIYNPREGAVIRLLDIDMTALFNCLKSTAWFGTGKLLDETSDGGLVFYATVIGPNSSSAGNTYGVRIRNSAELKSTVALAEVPRGLTFTSDQALYTMGNFNSTNKKPVALYSDSFNILSTNWSDASCTDSSHCAFSGRTAAATTVNAAMLSGTDTTGDVDGTAGQGGTYGGGAHNFPRLQEDWSGDALNIRGSFVSLSQPRHVDGVWQQNDPYYNVPNRNYDYDVSFNNSSNLPPLSLRFVYLKQELFVREF
jgi:hypothetical protein